MATPLFDLTGKVALVTGGSKGLGKAMARGFAEAGADVVICIRHANELEQALTEILQGTNVRGKSFVTDMTDRKAVQALADATMQAMGRVDILVNNAGAFDGGPLDEVSLQAWENVIGACLTGTFLCSRAAFRMMKPQKAGRILNIGSISAQRPREGSAPYAAAKFGVWGLTQAIALDARPYGIVCSCLHPGNVLVERRIESGNTADDEPMMQPESIARAALAMVTLPPDVNFLEAIVLPRDQAYLGRG